MAVLLCKHEQDLERDKEMGMGVREYFYCWDNYKIDISLCLLLRQDTIQDSKPRTFYVPVTFFTRLQDK